MPLDQNTLAILANQFFAHPFALAFIAPFFGGEAAVLFLAFLSGQGVFPLWGIILGSFFGMITLDAFWFFLPRSPWAKRFKARFSVNEKYRQIESRLESLSHHNDILVLFISKVLIGTRILVLAYLSLRNIPFWTFFGYNAIATFFWAVCLGYLGWFAGLGFYNLSEAYHNITTGALYIALALGVFYGILWYIRTWITKT